MATSIRYKYMIYSTYKGGILHDYHIPCYHNVCPNCKVNSKTPVCEKCNAECIQEVYNYAFFNNQVYQERINQHDQSKFYVTIVDNFNGTLSRSNKPDNTVSYKNVIKQLYRKCR